MSAAKTTGLSFLAADYEKLYTDCTLCPRQCHVNRFERSGFCGAGVLPKVARAALHQWEEPCISGYVSDPGTEASAGTSSETGPDISAPSGSGAVFFSHCTLRCIFCQNHEISAGGFGKEISVTELSEIFLRLQDEGAHNINLVTATHFLPSVLQALESAKPKLHIPVVYNCGGFETVETVRMLEGFVDIWLPDFKYYDDSLALELSAAPHYKETAADAIREMLRQAGSPCFYDDPALHASQSEGCGKAGPNPRSAAPLLQKGVIIRHMVLPGHRQDSINVLKFLADTFPRDSFLISLLSQYTPFHKAASDPAYAKLNRRITSFEYDSVVNEAVRLGLKGYMQEKSSAKEEYTPSFDLTGIL